MYYEVVLKSTHNLCFIAEIRQKQCVPQFYYIYVGAMSSENLIFAYAKTKAQVAHYRTADQLLCFCHIGSTIPLLPKSEISSLQLYSPVFVRPGRKPPKTDFLAMRLIYSGYLQWNRYL